MNSCDFPKILALTKDNLPSLSSFKMNVRTKNLRKRSIKEIKALNLTHLVEEMVIYHIELHIRQNVAPTFWKKFMTVADGQQGFEHFKTAVDGLYTSVTEFLPLLKKLEYLIQDETTCVSLNENDILSRFKLIVRSIYIIKSTAV